MTTRSGRQQRYRHAIVGTGGIAKVHAAALGQFRSRARLVAVVDIDERSADTFRTEWGVPNAYASIDELLQHERVDVVHLCTPPALHETQASAVLRAGAHVLSEKPAALSLRAIDEIRRVERESSGSFGTIFQHRFGTGAAKLRLLMQAGTLGEPLMGICHTLWFRPDSYFDLPWRGSWSSEGGGPTLGHGIHQMDLMSSLLGPWRHVVAVADRRRRRTNTEDFSGALVTYESGAVVSMVNSLVSPRETSYLRLDFEAATVELEHVYGYGDDDWLVTPAPGAEEDVLGQWGRGPSGIDSGHAAQFGAVWDALDRGEPLPVRSDESRLITELVAAIYASAFQGRRVERGSLGPDSPFYGSMAGSGAPWSPVKPEVPTSSGERTDMTADSASPSPAQEVNHVRT